jgi:hypothetical protein
MPHGQELRSEANAAIASITSAVAENGRAHCRRRQTGGGVGPELAAGWTAGERSDFAWLMKAQDRMVAAALTAPSFMLCV